MKSSSRWGAETWGAVLHTNRASRSETSSEEKGEWGKSELREIDMKAESEDEAVQQDRSQ